MRSPIMQEIPPKSITQARNHRVVSNYETHGENRKSEFSQLSDFQEPAENSNFSEFMENLMNFLNSQPIYHRLVKKSGSNSENISEISTKSEKEPTKEDISTSIRSNPPETTENLESASKNMEISHRNNRSKVIPDNRFPAPKKPLFGFQSDNSNLKRTFADVTKGKRTKISNIGEKKVQFKETPKTIDNSPRATESRDKNSDLSENRDQNGLTLIMNNLNFSYCCIK